MVPLHAAPGGRCSCGQTACKPGKHPRTSHGLLEASADPAVVAVWWTRWPDANIGCIPGRSGRRYVVLDVDGPEGEATAQQLGALAEPTLEVRTGRGRHRWYQHPGGHIPNSLLGPQLDVRGDAGYVLLPPSVHASGKVYRWHRPLEDVATLPPAVVARLTTSRRAARSRGTGALGDCILEGERNNVLTAFAGALRRRGAGKDVLLAALRGMNATVVVPPLTEDELDAIAENIAHYPVPTSTTDDPTLPQQGGARRHPHLLLNRPVPLTPGLGRPRR